MVPPGAKSACPEGRFLISDDSGKDPARVATLPLDDLTATPSQSVFDTPEGWKDYRRILSNDHDLVAQPNGDVLLIKDGTDAPAAESETGLVRLRVQGRHRHSRQYVGARRAIGADGVAIAGLRQVLHIRVGTRHSDARRRSRTFQDFSGGLPQNSPSTVAPGSPEQPVYQMGGTDGIMARVDHVTGRVYLSVQLVGNLPATGRSFTLSDTKINRTVGLTSDDGVKWSQDHLLAFRGWRVDVVPRPRKALAVAHNVWNELFKSGSAFVMHSCKGGFDIEQCPATVAPIQQGKWGWDTLPWSHSLLYKKEKEPTDRMNTNVAGQTHLVRSPSSENLLLAYMHSFRVPDLGDGYRLYGFNGKSTWLQFSPIKPMVPDPDSFILHVTPVDAGSGPLFWYWYDVNAGAKHATIRGRLITQDNEETQDFSVSRGRDSGVSFDLTETRCNGDYHTAGGYVAARGSTPTYHYYPIWRQPDGLIRVAHVAVTLPLASLSDAQLQDLGFIRRTNSDRETFRKNIDLSLRDPPHRRPAGGSHHPVERCRGTRLRRSRQPDGPSGTSSRSRVPRPGAESTCSEPPIDSARSPRLAIS